MGLCIEIRNQTSLNFFARSLMKIDVKRGSDSGVLCAVVDLHKREGLGVRAVTETCSSRLQASDEGMTNCYLKFFDMINKIYKIKITALRK